MDLLNKKVVSREVIEPGEESLHQEYSVVNVEKREVILAGIDGGSTQTRVTLVTKDDSSLENMYIVPSIFSEVVDGSELLPKSNKLYDMMDSTVINQLPQHNSMFGKVRVIRGTKFRNALLPVKRIDSTTQKISNENFYINVIDALGYSLVQHYAETGVPTQVEVYLGISLPPDDIASSKAVNLFKSRIIGDYTWQHEALGVKSLITIKGVYIQSEPEAFIKAYYATQEEEVPELTLHIEVGGRSTGVEILDNGNTITSASRTFPYGGNQLIDMLSTIYSEAVVGRAPNREAFSRALVTGALKDGRSSIDITKYITMAKQQFANQLVSDIISQIFDQQRSIDVNSLDSITCSGRVCSPGEYEVSIADFMVNSFKKYSPNTEFKYIEQNFIPLGNVMGAYMEYGGYLEDSVEEVEPKEAEAVEFIKVEIEE